MLKNSILSLSCQIYRSEHDLNEETMSVEAPKYVVSEIIDVQLTLHVTYQKNNISGICNVCTNKATMASVNLMTLFSVLNHLHFCECTLMLSHCVWNSFHILHPVCLNSTFLCFIYQNCIFYWTLGVVRSIRRNREKNVNENSFTQNKYDR